jgi:pimeloyl-ACP methyl ester carboxylesterase
MDAMETAGAAVPDRDTVVFLHGLGRTRYSMSGLAHAATKRGYHVVNHGYQSRRGRIDDHAAQLRTVIEEIGATAGRIHFVTHSLGGIVVRAMLANRSAWPRSLGRVVMLSPPNQGSELADLLASNRIFQLALGPAAAELGTGPESTPNQLGAVDFELGVITGDRSMLPLSKRIFAGPGDGKVSVERARVEGMRDFLVVRRTHTFIMWAPDVATAVFQFLEGGSFGAQGTEAPPPGELPR